MIMIFVWFP